MKFIVHRCMKRPGLIDRARTYYLELNDKGLYIIAIGLAGQKPHIPRETLVTVAAQAIASGIVQKMWEKMEVEIVANEKRISEGKMEEMANEKKSYFIPKDQIEAFKIKKEYDLYKIAIKWPKDSINLFAHEGYFEVLSAMENAIGKG